MEFSFGYSFEDYQEAAKAMRQRSRKSLNIAASRWAIVLTGIIGAALVIAAALLEGPDANGMSQPTKLSEFLFGLTPWVIVLGAGWSVIVARADPMTRAAMRRVMLTLLLTGICISYLLCLTPAPPSTPMGFRDILIHIAPVVVFFIGFGIALVLTYRLLSRRMWNGLPHLQLPHTARFSEERVEFENTNALCSYRWPGIVVFRETTNLFVLQTSKYTFHMLPKRACKSVEEIDAVRSLIEKHVANADPVAIGFAVVVSPPPLPTAPPRMVESLPPRRMN